jgi:hypothetical protein
MQQIEKKLRHGVGRIATEVAAIDEGEHRLIASRTDHNIEGLPPTIDKHDMLSIEAGNVAAGLDCAGVDAVAEILVDDRVGLPEAVIGPREAVLPRQADGAIDRP